MYTAALYIRRRFTKTAVRSSLRLVGDDDDDDDDGTNVHHGVGVDGSGVTRVGVTRGSN